MNFIILPLLTAFEEPTTLLGLIKQAFLRETAIEMLLSGLKDISTEAAACA